MRYFNQNVDNEDQEYRQDYPSIMTVKEVMELMYIGKNKIYELLDSGELKGFRIGRMWRIKKDSVDEYIKRH